MNDWTLRFNGPVITETVEVRRMGGLGLGQGWRGDWGGGGVSVEKVVIW